MSWWLLAFIAGSMMSVWGPWLCAGLYIFVASRRKFSVLGLVLISGYWASWHNPVLSQGRSGEMVRIVAPGSYALTSSYAVAQLGSSQKTIIIRHKNPLIMQQWLPITCRPIAQISGLQDCWAQESATFPTQAWADRLRQWLEGRLARLNPGLRPWLMALLIGDLSALAPTTIQDFRVLGLMHLLVISGMHFVTLAQFSHGLGRWLGLKAFIFFRQLNFQQHFFLAKFSTVLPIVVMAVFGEMLGFPPPCQRAFFSSLIGVSRDLGWGEWPLTKRWLVVAVLQTVFFPSGFLSLSNILTWGCVATLECYGRDNCGVKKQGLTAAIAMQIVITCFVSLVLGWWSHVAIWASLLLASLFNGIAYGAFLWLLVTPVDVLADGMAAVLSALLTFFIWAYHQLFILNQQLFGNTGRLLPLPLGLRVIGLFVLLLIGWGYYYPRAKLAEERRLVVT